MSDTIDVEVSVPDTPAPEVPPVEVEVNVEPPEGDTSHEIDLEHERRITQLESEVERLRGEVAEAKSSATVAEIVAEAAAETAEEIAEEPPVVIEVEEPEEEPEDDVPPEREPLWFRPLFGRR